MRVEGESVGGRDRGGWRMQKWGWMRDGDGGEVDASAWMEEVEVFWRKRIDVEGHKVEL